MALFAKFDDCLNNANNFQALCDYWIDLYEDPPNAKIQFIETLFHLSGWTNFNYESDFQNLGEIINNKEHYQLETWFSDKFIKIFKQFISKVFLIDNGKILNDTEFGDDVMTFLSVAYNASSDHLRVISVSIGFEILASIYKLVSTNIYDRHHPILIKYFELIFKYVLEQGVFDIVKDINLVFASGMKYLANNFPLYMLEHKWLSYWELAVETSRPNITTVILEALESLFIETNNNLRGQKTLFARIRDGLFQIITYQEGPQANICLTIIMAFDKLCELTLTEDEKTLLFNCSIHPDETVAYTGASFLLKKGFVKTTSPNILLEDILKLVEVLPVKAEFLVIDSFYENLSEVPWEEWTSWLVSVNKDKIETCCSLLYWYAKKAILDYVSPNRKKELTMDLDEKRSNLNTFISHFEDHWILSLIENENINKNANALHSVINLIDMFDNTTPTETLLDIAITLKQLMFTSQDAEIIKHCSFMLHKLSKMNKLTRSIFDLIEEIVPILEDELFGFVEDQCDYGVLAAARINSITGHHFFDDRKMWNYAFSYLKRLQMSLVGHNNLVVVLCVEVLFNLLYSKLNWYFNIPNDREGKQMMQDIILKRVTDIPTLLVPLLTVDDELICLAAFTAMSKLYYDFGPHAVCNEKLCEFASSFDENIPEMLGAVFSFIPSNASNPDVVTRCKTALKYVSPLFVSGLIPVEYFSQLIFIYINEKNTNYENIICNCINEFRHFNEDSEEGLSRALLKATDEYGSYSGNENHNFVEILQSSKTLCEALGQSTFVGLFFAYIEKIKSGDRQYDDYLPFLTEYLSSDDHSKLIDNTANMEQRTKNINLIIENSSLLLTP